MRYPKLSFILLFQFITNAGYAQGFVVHQSNSAKVAFNTSDVSEIEFVNENVNDDVNYNLYMHSTKQVLDDGTDLNQVGGDDTYLMASGRTYHNAPKGSTTGFLRVTTVNNNWILQEFIQFSDPCYYKRRGRNGEWSDWQRIESGNQPSQVSYLTSTGDKTDRTADIEKCLKTTGRCSLGAGRFYVRNLDMPDYSMIAGSGSSTEVILLGNAESYAIKMSKSCSIKDLRLRGRETYETPNKNIGDRHGVLWLGDRSETNDHSTQPRYGIIDNLWIDGFNGGGITICNTGGSTDNYIAASNCHIYNCGAGVNISYWSEYHKLTNIRCDECYYGIINNGGNNMFVNCDVSSSCVGMLMDNSEGQSINNTHGSAVGCIFNHIKERDSGVKILNCNNGFIFSGCQLFYSDIYIKDSEGIVFANCNYGKRDTKITIEGGRCVHFIGNMHEGEIPIDITNNDKVIFSNCYTKDGSIIK